MPKKIILLTENISYPCDEGQKNASYNLAEALQAASELCVVTKHSDKAPAIESKEFRLNKLFINPRLRFFLRSYQPETILYIPESSCTFNSLLRARVVKLMYPQSKLLLLAVQHRTHSFFQRVFLPWLAPDLLLLLSAADQRYFERHGFQVNIVPPAVDRKRFHAVSDNTKIALRKKHGFELDKTVILHVGHIKENRNLDCFLRVQGKNNMHVVIVGSTSTQIDLPLKQKLQTAGIRVISDHVPEIQELYQLSDIYVFPVVERTAAIEMPLSILEALACNLYVLTTKFGGLSQYFDEDADLRYFDGEDDLSDKLRDFRIRARSNDKKIERYDWGTAARIILNV